MSSYFFRVEHDLLRSEAFRSLGGSAIKVYLVIGLHTDFGTDWGYPSTRTIAKQAGLSRQTVIDAINDLVKAGLLAASKSRGRSTAYKILRQAAPERRPTGPRASRSKNVTPPPKTGPNFLDAPQEAGLNFLVGDPETGPVSRPGEAQEMGLGGREARPNLETGTREDTTSIPIPGTPFRIGADGRLVVAVDLQELLTSQGIPKNLAQRLATRKDPESVAKVLLNALYLQSQGKLQNGPGYIRAGIEDGYELLPQVASRLEGRRRELQAKLRTIEDKKRKLREEDAREAQEEAVAYVIDRLHPEDLQRFLDAALLSLPEPIVRRNPTLSNPFVRSKVYELACGEPVD